MLTPEAGVSATSLCLGQTLPRSSPDAAVRPALLAQRGANGAEQDAQHVAGHANS
jgi:hypothetical protein